MEPVRSKADYYRRWVAGEFGNRPQAWETWGEVVASGYRGPVVVRSRKSGSQLARYRLAFEDAKKHIAGRERDFSFNEPTPDDDLLIQGELERGVGGLALSYCCDKVTMREAMKRCQVVRGLQASILLRRFGQGCEHWLYELLDAYEGHVIEFGLYRVPFGTHKSRLVVWEVRSY